ncbi:endothelin-3-like [Lampetra fluviatilis]
MDVLLLTLLLPFTLPGRGVPVVAQVGVTVPQGWGDEGAIPGGAVAAASWRWRCRRCACHNLADRECIYFCHLDIVWVHAPRRRLVPYGVTGSRVRGRREAATGSQSPSRCLCLLRKDRACTSYCKIPAPRPPRAPHRLEGRVLRYDLLTHTARRDDGR